LSVLALIFAVLAYSGNQANRTQLVQANSRIDTISAIQSESKGELDIFKVPLAHERSVLAEERRKQAEHEAKIIKDVTQLQVKMKVSPTLEEQLREGASAPVPASPVVAIPVTASAVAISVPVHVPAPVPAKAETKPPVEPAAKPVVAEKKPVPVAKEVKKSAPAPTSSEKEAKAKALKQTIEDFNRNDRK
jgi:hypothetical protein